MRFQRSLRHTLPVLAIALAVSGCASSEQGGFLPALDQPAGENCAAIREPGAPYWHGYVRGLDESPMITFEGYYTVIKARCFTSESACRDWLYDTQSARYLTNRRWCRLEQPSED